MITDNTPKSGSHDDNIFDLLNDMDMSPIEETDEEVLASLTEGLEGVVFDAPTVPNATPSWLMDAQEYAAKHGPFSTAQIVKIVWTLNGFSLSSTESGQ